MGLALTAADLSALEARTEGWFAGLQLAALAMRDHQDRSGFIRSFSGSNRYIVDYLAAEVFTSQPAHLQTFLLQTAILDRMCGSLCDAVMGLMPDERPMIKHEGPTKASESVPNTDHPLSPFALRPSSDSYSQIILEQLERANLFVVPLDGERQWYRYHHLFAEVLRHRLTSGVPAETVAALHRRASAWYERQGLVGEAVQHAQMAADHERATDLIEQHGVRIIVTGQVHTVLNWLSALPDALVRARPLLCTVHALALLLTNQLKATEARIQDAERGILPDTLADQAQIIQGRTAVLRAILVRYSGDFAGCVAFAEQALRVLPATETVARTVAMLNAARAFLVSGDVTDANERLAIAVVAPIRASGNLFGALAAFTNLAQMQILQGRLRAAVATFHEAMQIASDPEVFRSLEGSPAYYFGMGAVLCEWNELDAAEQHLAQGMDLVAGPLTVDAAYITQGYLALARLQQARGNPAAAQLTLETSMALARQRGFVTHLIARGAAAQAQLALAQGNLAAAVAWADAPGLHAADDRSFPREAEELALARVWIAQAGCIRRFVDEGPVMATMLHAADTRRIAPDYVRRLLAAFPTHAGGRMQAEGDPALQHPSSPVAQPLVEPLSARELEVLRLIAGGKSNAEVARTLVIAISTVKTHTNSIFGKLQVTSRTQAIARARDLHLL
jgi:LuxR family maltose regulon positive regulatory protein